MNISCTAASAAASIPANIIQGVGGLVISIILYPILVAIPDINQMASAGKGTVDLFKVS